MVRSSLALLVALAALGTAWAQTQVSERALTCDKQPELLHNVAFTETSTGYSDAERACWLDWPQAQALAQGQGGQWVDVRDAGAIRRLGLPGATAVGLPDLADKTFLRGQSLVLVGTGVDLKALSVRCATLRQAGQFKGVHVLLGGVRRWRQAGQPMQSDGDVWPADQASAQELWVGAADDLWQIATAGLTAPQIANLPVPRDRLLDLGADAAQAVDRLTFQVNAERLPMPRQWLVIADNAERLAQMQALWRQRDANGAADSPVWLIGAWPAYASYLDQQKTLAAHAGRPLPRLCGM
ncbi:rhodanese-like domain-containing protein [Ottowia testudinis]|uniref:Rhodanese-like domain-containing protein n=1 Tax=Ottowia testudinis TaxID=2816950 RepID=A0A975CIH2_9BURK|nr:rhodanese-like domain-containing protein [Ottowia testudinis]QTD46377.1 rhodanese-like domain-containing protein [Ottowia testudinis]